MSDPYGSNSGSNPYGPPSGQTPPPPPPAGGYGGGAGGGYGGGFGPPPGGFPGGGDSMPPKTDGVSVASLVLSLLCCTGPIGLILGFVGLSRTKGGQRKGRGFAIAGIVLGVISVIALSVGGVVLVNFVKSIVTPDNAEAGQCVNITTDDDDSLFIRKKDCADKHDGEVVYVGEAREIEETAQELSLSESAAAVTTDAEAQKAICSALVGDKAASFPADLTWTVAFNEDDRDNPADDDPFICYVESSSKFTGSLL